MHELRVYRHTYGATADDDTITTHTVSCTAAMPDCLPPTIAAAVLAGMGALAHSGDDAPYCYFAAPEDEDGIRRETTVVLDGFTRDERCRVRDALDLVGNVRHRLRLHAG